MTKRTCAKFTNNILFFVNINYKQYTATLICLQKKNKYIYTNKKYLIQGFLNWH